MRQAPVVAVAIAVFAAMHSGWEAAANPATVHEAVGGAGDRDDVMGCPHSHPLLVGFFGRTGHWIDQIRIRCAEILPGFKTGSVIEKDERRGGGGGGDNPGRSCHTNAGIRDININVGYDNGKAKYVVFVQFSCYKPSTGGFTNRATFGGAVRYTNFDGRRTFNQACSGSDYATGITVRYGTHVNAVGLVCARLKEPPPPIILFPMPPPGGGGPGKAPTPPDIPSPPPQNPQPGTCRPGFVPRVARPSDLVCVTPNSAETVKQENATAYTRWTNGPYGPQTCIMGFVWREAFDGDTVCVTPERRGEVWQENQMAPSRAY